MSEIKQMYLDAYYGKTFTEVEKPDETQVIATEDAEDFKRVYRKNAAKKKQ